MSFEAFWKAYPRKVGKLAAMREWQKLKPDLEAVLRALEWQRWDDLQYCPHPRTWLHQGRWMDEPPASVTREHWRDECQRLHGGTCSRPEWHCAIRDRRGQTA